MSELVLRKDRRHCLDCGAALGILHRWGCVCCSAHCEDCRFEVVRENETENAALIAELRQQRLKREAARSEEGK